MLARDDQVLPQFSESLWWLIAAPAVGLAAGFGFHVMDTGAYRDQDAANALSSPTKIWHDFVVYPVLFGLLLWAGVPLLAADWRGFWTFFGPLTWLSIAALVSWAILGIICDGRRGLRAYDMHPAWDTAEFAVTHRYAT